MSDDFNRDMDCLSCNYYKGNLIDGYIFCYLRGPLTGVSRCNKYSVNPSAIEAKSSINYNDKNCKDCMNFKLQKNTKAERLGLNKSLPEFWGTCSKYLVREYDGSIRKACSMLEIFLDEKNMEAQSING